MAQGKNDDLHLLVFDLGSRQSSSLTVPSAVKIKSQCLFKNDYKYNIENNFKKTLLQHILETCN